MGFKNGVIGRRAKQRRCGGISDIPKSQCTRLIANTTASNNKITLVHACERWPGANFSRRKGTQRR